jgi:hypothetical protein
MQLTDNTDCNGNVGCEIAETEVEGMFTNDSVEKHPLTSYREKHRLVRRSQRWRLDQWRLRSDRIH